MGLELKRLFDETFREAVKSQSAPSAPSAAPLRISRKPLACTPPPSAIGAEEVDWRVTGAVCLGNLHDFMVFSP